MERKPKILLLEDDPDMRSLLERILSYQDYDVTSVETGYQAIEAAKKTAFDLIVADVRVDGPDGIEVLSEAKKDRPDVGTLAVSGYSSLEDDARAERIGIGGFLRKPFETQRFLELVKQQLHKRQKKRQERNLEQEVGRVLLTTLNTLFQAYGTTPQSGQFERVSRAREMAMKLGLACGLEGQVLYQVAAASALTVMPDKVVGDLCKALTEVGPYVDSLSEALLYYEKTNDTDPRPPLEARIVRLVKAVLDQADLDEAGLDKELLALYRSEESLQQRLVPSNSEAQSAQSESFLAIAQALERAGDGEGAAAAYKDLLQSHPEGEAVVEAQLGMARLAAARKDAAKVRLWVDRATQVAASVGRFRSCLTDYYGGLLLRQVGDEDAKRLLRRAVPSLLKFGFADAVALSAVALIAEGEKIDPERWQAISRRLLSPSLSRDITKHALWFIPALLETLSRHPLPGFLSQFINHLPGLFCKMLEEQLLGTENRNRLVDLLGEEESHVPESVWRLLRQDADPEVRKSASELKVRVEAVASPSLIRLFSLGPFEVQVDGEIVPDRIWRTQRTRFLLAYLGYEWGRQVHEEILMEALWPEAETLDKKGLYWNTSAIRRIFKGMGFQLDVVERIGETLRTNPEVSVWHDARVLEEHLSAGQTALREGKAERAKAELQAALDIYRGPYLEGCFLDWALRRRQSYERQTADAALQLADLHFESEAYREAVEAARESLKLEPARQEAHLMVMKALMKGGRPEAAIDQYHECENLLRHHYNTEPETVMIEYYHRAKMLM
ncbi:MAG: response regulator [Candidatus Eremiobacteraeota bacterium]|nr:response regulator [Candidatus Eremiobacteraeota bacterium]